MPTSGTTTFSISRDDIINRAYRLLGVTSSGQTPSTDLVSDASFALNTLVKAWQADGMPLWAIRSYSVSLTNGDATYNIGNGQTVNTPKPLKLTQAFNHDSVSDVDIPMRILTRQEYNMLGNKTSSGNPIQIFYDPQRTYGILSVFPVPTSTEATNNTIVIHYQRPFEDFNASTDELDFPQEWFDAVCYGLACRLAPEAGISSTDRKQLWQEMTIIKNEALGFGTEEGSIHFTASLRNW